MLSLSRVVKAVVAIGLSTACIARAQGTDYALVKGPVTVWTVSPATAAEKARIAARKLGLARTLPTTVQASTAGDFGQPSSNVGQTAGSYGTPSANVGRNASDTGQTSGSYGQPAGSLGGTAGNTGQTAGSYGQTAGSYGQTSSSYGQISSTYGDGNPVRSRAGAAQGARLPPIDELAGSRTASPNLAVSFVDVSAEELRDSLLRARGTEAFPDVVSGVLPAWWDEGGWGVTMLGSLRFLDVAAEEFGGRMNAGARAVVLKRAPHPETARAYVLWLREGTPCTHCQTRRRQRELAAAVAVAVGTFRRVLQGADLGASADDAAAQFSGTLAQQMALVPASEGALAGLGYHVDVLDAGANERLAVVSLRAVAESDAAFGATRAVVVLRKDAAGHWRVLHLSPGVARLQMSSAGEDLLAYTRPVAPEKVAHVVGISQAAPVDGDARPPQPDLWWDNGGGAQMQVVEWQRKDGNAWGATRLLLAPDDSSRVRTRVTASFAEAGGEYRWRVWSVGVGGVIVISPWRRMTILP